MGYGGVGLDVAGVFLSRHGQDGEAGYEQQRPGPVPKRAECLVGLGFGSFVHRTYLRWPGEGFG